MKAFLVKVNVFKESKLHVVTADKESEVLPLVKDCWCNDSSLEIIKIEEITRKEVVITKHN